MSPSSSLEPFTQLSYPVSQVSVFNTMLKRNGKDGSVEYDTHSELENAMCCHFG